MKNIKIYDERELCKLNRRQLFNLIVYYCTENDKVMKWFDDNDEMNGFYGFADEEEKRLLHVDSVNSLREFVWKYQTIAHNLKRNKTIHLRTEQDKKAEEFRWILNALDGNEEMISIMNNGSSGVQSILNDYCTNAHERIFKQCEYYKSYNEFVSSPEYKKMVAKQKLKTINTDFKL